MPMASYGILWPSLEIHCHFYVRRATGGERCPKPPSVQGLVAVKLLTLLLVGHWTHTEMPEDSSEPRPSRADKACAARGEDLGRPLPSLGAIAGPSSGKNRGPGKYLAGACACTIPISCTIPKTVSRLLHQLFNLHESFMFHMCRSSRWGVGIKKNWHAPHVTLSFWFCQIIASRCCIQIYPDASSYL